MSDEKFNDMAIRQFEEAYPGIHEYWIIGSKLSLTKSPLANCCSLDALISMLTSRDNFFAVIFHSLPSSRYRLLRHITKDKMVVWIGWGYDYYPLLNNSNSKDPLVLEKTRELTRNIHSAKTVAKQKLKTLVKKLGLWKRDGLVSDLARVNYFSPVLDSEYDLVRRQLSLNAEYILWNYGTAEDDLSMPGLGFSQGHNILAGNSASATNNHVELFEAIRDKVDLHGRKVITPLSYGNPHNRDKVMERGTLLLGEAFCPLTEFMPKDEYLSTLRSCGFVMMNHLRQQAVGNICMAMLMGSKIYLHSDSPLSPWFKKRGAYIGSMANLDMVPLDEEEKLVNRKLVYSHWGRVHQRQKTLQLISKALGENHE